MGLFDAFIKNKKEFHIEDVREQKRLFPRTFLVPAQEEIENLQMDSLVKLIFVMEKQHENGCRAERMWVKITSIQNGMFTGVLDNEPYYLKTVKCGDEITFKDANIACIYSEKQSFNEELFAIITKKALENRQINWVVRSGDLENEQDSGWQLFFGDESPSYLDDPKNASIVSLEHVLSFEPLLESVFGSSGNAYEYSSETNSFIEVKE